MAKKTTKKGNPLATENPEGGVFVTLPGAVRNNREALRWLHHWVVDALADRGYVRWMVADVEGRLQSLGTDIVSNSVTDLVRQAIAATSQPEESQPPKNAKKPKRK